VIHGGGLSWSILLSCDAIFRESHCRNKRVSHPGPDEHRTHGCLSYGEQNEPCEVKVHASVPDELIASYSLDRA